MQQTKAIVGLMAQTSIHAGTGQTTGVIDLPIQREGHNGWPCIFGSGVKGAFRAQAESQNEPNPDAITNLFGPRYKKDGEETTPNDHAGALRISDARLLLFPVRSLTSQFKWVTSPAALRRFQLDLKRFGYEHVFSIPTVGQDGAITFDQSGQPLYLEEYRFNTEAKPDISVLIDTLALLINQDGIEDLLKQQLVIISDDNFSHLVEHATPVNTHIAIDQKTKTVAQGALWTEETLPPETLLYIGLDAVQARSPDKTSLITEADWERNWSAAGVFMKAKLLFDDSWVQLGGNETVGMGWCYTHFLALEAVKEGQA